MLIVFFIVFFSVPRDAKLLKLECHFFRRTINVAVESKFCVSLKEHIPSLRQSQRVLYLQNRKNIIPFYNEFIITKTDCSRESQGGGRGGGG